MIKKKVVIADDSYTKGYDLIKKTQEGSEVTYQLEIPLKFEMPTREITLDALVASLDNQVDNTGNTRTWPSEELLAYYLLGEEFGDI